MAVKKKHVFTSAALALGAVIAGAFYAGTKEKLQGGKGILVYENLTAQQGKKALKLLQDLEFDETVEGLMVTFITYDSSAPGYEPDNEKTWTKDKWLGNLVIHVESRENDGIKHVNRAYQVLKKAMPNVKPTERKPIGRSYDITKHTRNAVSE